MKKQLLSTSALVAAGLVGFGATSVGVSTRAEAQTAPGSSPISLTLGGFMRQSVSYATQNDVNTQSIANGLSTTGKPAKIAQTSDTEIYFLGKTTLANGISVSVRVELEGNTSTDMIDESWMTLDGTFGTVMLGSTDNAAQKMQYSAPLAWTGAAFGAGNINGQNPTNAGFPTTGIGNNANGALSLGEDDSNLISYFTPRVEGFQLGYSYIPHLQQDNNNAINSGESYVRGNAVGINFVRNVMGVDAALFAGWRNWHKPEASGVGVLTAAQISTMKNPTAYMVGGNLGYAGFKVGAGYGTAKNNLLIGGIGAAGAANTANNGITAGVDGSGRVWEEGVTYTFGPTTVGIYHQASTFNDLTVNSSADSQETWSLQGTYVLGPGVNLTAALSNIKFKGERTSASNNGSTAAGIDTDNNNITGLAVAVALSF